MDTWPWGLRVCSPNRNQLWVLQAEALEARAADERLEHSAWHVVARQARFAHAASVVDNYSCDFILIRCFYFYQFLVRCWTSCIVSAGISHPVTFYRRRFIALHRAFSCYMTRSGNGVLVFVGLPERRLTSLYFLILIHFKSNPSFKLEMI